ncbi:MAG: CDP-alcohol phosphatidyltransferase family protein [Chrysiogenetes bacterium]|nr:CDP-alcohol phosphatidyltransferase family protein [Chrysiogenetes bacterium]
MSIPAVVFVDPVAAHLEVAALSVLDRMIVALHRGGCTRITLVTDIVLPELKRTWGLGISFNAVPRPPELEGPTLVAQSCLLIQPADVAQVIEDGGRLATDVGEPLPLGVTNRLGGTLEESLPIAPLVPAEGVTALIETPEQAKAATKALWISLTSSADGIVDVYFNRPLGRPLSKLLIRTPVTPNQVTIFAMLVGVLSGWFFSRGDHVSGIVGALVFQLAAMIDCIDGDIARSVFKETPVGKWLDIAADQVAHVAIFGGIAWGVTQSGSDAPTLYLGASMIVGALISFAVVVRGLAKPEDQRDPRLAKLIDSATTRDFSILLIIAAWFDALDWFLWVGAFGVHGFWILALAIQTLGAKPAREAA